MEKNVIFSERFFAALRMTNSISNAILNKTTFERVALDYPFAPG